MIMKHKRQITPGSWRLRGKMIVAETGNIAETCHIDSFMEGTQKGNGVLLSAAPNLLRACQLARIRLESGDAEERKFNASLVKVLNTEIKRAIRVR
jgi:hypothetical protein